MQLFTGRLAVVVAVIVLDFAAVCLSFPSPSNILFKFILTENLALKKPAEQSSRHNKSSGAENAVDGNRNPLFDANGNCALTNESGDPSWWRVDLGINRAPVSDVLIVNRLFPPSARQTNGYYKITLGEK